MTKNSFASLPIPFLSIFLTAQFLIVFQKSIRPHIWDQSEKVDLKNHSKRRTFYKSSFLQDNLKAKEAFPRAKTRKLKKSFLKQRSTHFLNAQIQKLLSKNREKAVRTKVRNKKWCKGQR